MAQSSVLFAIAKTKMKQSKAISQNDLSRLMDAASFEDAKQVLVDIGFMPSIHDDYEYYADKYVAEAAHTLAKYSPDETLSKILLYHYDAHNLKLLFKARLLNVEPEYLYTCGTLDLQALKHMFINRQYKNLPDPLQTCMEDLEKRAVTGVEPYVVDAMIDKAVYKHLFALLKMVRNPKLSDYLHKKLTFSNVLIALRLQKMHKAAEVLNVLLLDGGYIRREDFIRAYGNLHSLAKKLTEISPVFAVDYMRYLNGQSSLSQLETAADNILIAIFKGVPYQPLHINNLILYSIVSQRQAAALRLIMAAKSGGASNDDIRERMRDIYAK